MLRRFRCVQIFLKHSARTKPKKDGGRKREPPNPACCSTLDMRMKPSATPKGTEQLEDKTVFLRFPTSCYESLVVAIIPQLLQQSPVPLCSMYYYVFSCCLSNNSNLTRSRIFVLTANE